MMEDPDWELVNTLSLGLYQTENWYTGENCLCRQIIEFCCGEKDIKDWKCNRYRLISLAVQEWFIITSVHLNRKTKQEIYTEQDCTQGLIRTCSSKSANTPKMYSDDCKSFVLFCNVHTLPDYTSAIILICITFRRCFLFMFFWLFRFLFVCN